MTRRFGLTVGVLGILLHVTGCAPYSVPSQYVVQQQERFRPEMAEWHWSDDPQPLKRVLSQGKDIDGPSDMLVSMYQRHMRRPSTGRRGCQYLPSCSAYARAATRRYGGLAGFLLALDRLVVRENPGYLAYYPLIWIENRQRLYDPVP